MCGLVPLTGSYRLYFNDETTEARCPKSNTTYYNITKYYFPDHCELKPHGCKDNGTDTLHISESCDDTAGNIPLLVCPTLIAYRTNYML